MRPFVFLIALTLGLAFLGHAHAEFPPKGFIVYEESASPDDRYAVLIPARGVPPQDEFKVGSKNFISDLKARKLLGRIDHTDFYEGIYHKYLKVFWAPDSTWCALVYEGRYGFESISVAEIERAKIHQAEIGSYIESTLNSRLKHADEDVDCIAYLRPGSDRKLRVRALGTTNIKRLENRKTICSLFQGTYDLSAQKWSVIDVRTLGDDDFDTLERAYDPFETGGRVFSSENERAQWLDERLNFVYSALRVVLPSGRFAAIKREQIEWLKSQPKHRPASVICVAWTARIKEMDKYLW